jgi:hypothetical protein
MSSSAVEHKAGALSVYLCPADWKSYIELVWHYIALSLLAAPDGWWRFFMCALALCWHRARAFHSEHIHMCAACSLSCSKNEAAIFLSRAACLFQFWQGAARYLAFKIYEWRSLADWICELRIRAVWSQTRIRNLKCTFRGPARSHILHQQCVQII